MPDRKLPEPEQMAHELAMENWHKIGSCTWCNPFGAMFYGPTRAWIEMRKFVYGEDWEPELRRLVHA